MPSHLTFFDDAVEEFLFAFELHQKLTSMPEAEPELLIAARCVRSFALAIEKGLKHKLAELDPYLLLAKLDRKLLIDIRREMMDNQVPSIFCCRKSLLTISAIETWDALCELKVLTSEQADVSAFDKALKRLYEIRNKAYHGELYAEARELISTIDEVLARFETVMKVMNPMWLQKLAERNGQFVSRLKAIENKVDANWQVLIDYLEKHGHINLYFNLTVMVNSGSEFIHVISSGAELSNYMLWDCYVPNKLASGFFNSFLTHSQCEARLIERERLLVQDIGQAYVESLLETTFKSLPRATLEPGILVIPSTNVWLSFELPYLNPSQLFLSANLKELRIDFEDGYESEGNVTGELDCAIDSRSTATKSIEMNGYASFKLEKFLDADSTANPTSKECTYRVLSLHLTFKAIA